MRAPEFLAVVFADGGEAAAMATAERHAPMTITRLRLDGGGLLLCRWDRRPVPASGMVAALDGTGGAPDVAVPRQPIDAAHAPAGLVAAVRQYRSYLWLDDDGRLTCWTDHIGMSRLYHARTSGGLLLSDDPGLLAGADAAPDPAGVCSFLVNGYPVRNRTLFYGVSSLPAASVVALSPHGASPVPYWRHRPGAEVWPDRRELDREIWARVSVAALDATEGRHAVISLSGGYDSTALLGILHGAGRPVSTYSFAFGEPRPFSDADVARRRAAILGAEYTNYRFDEDFDIAGMLRHHIDNGLVMRKPCYEVGVYDRVLADIEARGLNSVMLFGDEAFGQGAFRISSDHELLGSAALKSPRNVSRVMPGLAGDSAERLGDALWKDYDEILALPRMDNDEDTKDMLFLDSYLRANMVEMRRQTVGRRMPIALPLLDLRVVDMASHTPTSLRTQKRLFEALARRNLPALFRVGQARHSQGQPLIGAEMRRQHRSLAEAIGRLRQGISGVLSPVELAAALEALCATPAPAPSPAARALTTVGRFFIKRELAPTPLVDALRRLSYNKFEVSDPAVMLMRALHLAMTFDSLADASAASDATATASLSA